MFRQNSTLHILNLYCGDGEVAICFEKVTEK